MHPEVERLCFPPGSDSKVAEILHSIQNHPIRMPNGRMPKLYIGSTADLKRALIHATTMSVLPPLTPSSAMLRAGVVSYLEWLSQQPQHIEARRENAQSLRVRFSEGDASFR